MTGHRLGKIVIVGGGTAGWMAAAALGRFLVPGGVEVVLVESEEIGTIGVGEATIPPIQKFNHLLGIAEDEFLAATQGTFKLGIEFVDWGRVGDRYIHPFGRHGRDIAGIDFHQLYLREARRRALPPIDAFSVAAVAARAGRFAFPSGDPRQPASDLAYAYHFDAGLYARFLRRFSEQLGVVRHEGKVAEVRRRADSGLVQAMVLSDGRVIEGELFIDCSGFRGLLIEQALKTGYEDWSHWLPCDRAVAAPSANLGPPAPYTRATAGAAGWRWRIPLQHRTGNGHVYASRFLSDAQAEADLIAGLEGQALAEPRRLSFTPGRRKAAWVGNVVSLGLASGFIEPLESTSIHLIQHGVSLLLALLPDKRFTSLERDLFNEQMQRSFESVRDFVILHYKLTQRDDTPFWRYCRDMEPPASLARRLELFARRGRFLKTDTDLFALSSWVAVMFGQNLTPEDYDPLVDALDPGKVAQQIDAARRAITQAVETMQPHEAVLEGLCAPWRARQAPVQA